MVNHIEAIYRAIDHSKPVSLSLVHYTYIQLVNWLNHWPFSGYTGY